MKSIQKRLAKVEERLKSDDNDDFNLALLKYEKFQLIKKITQYN
jgi:hypothetical protein